MRALVLIALGACGRFGFDEQRIAPADGAAGDGELPTGIAFVQATATMSVNAQPPFTVSFPGPVTAGNTVVVYAWSWANAPIDFTATAASDSAGNVYTRAVADRLPDICAGGTGATGIYVAPAVMGGSFAIALVPAGDSQQIAYVAVEYSGLSANPILSGAPSLQDSGLSPLTFSSGSVMNVPVGSLLVSVATICGGYPDAVAWTDPNGGYNVRGIEPRTSFLAPGIAGDRITDIAGTWSQAWTVTFTGGTVTPVFGVAAVLR